MKEGLVEMEVWFDKTRQGDTFTCIDFVRTISVQTLFDRSNPPFVNADVDARPLIVEPDPAYDHVQGLLLGTHGPFDALVN